MKILKLPPVIPRDNSNKKGQLPGFGTRFNCACQIIKYNTIVKKYTSVCIIIGFFLVIFD